MEISDDPDLYILPFSYQPDAYFCCCMKQLFISILSFFFFSASLCGYADTASKELPEETIDGCISCKESVGHAGSEHNAVVTHAVHRAGGSTTPWKLLRFTNWANAYFIALRAVPGNQGIFVDPYLYCKPIRLQLIFPRHYFW